MKNFLFLTVVCVLLLGASVFFRKLAMDRMHPYQLQIVAGAIYAIEVPLWMWLIRREGITGYDPVGILWGTLCILTAVASAVLLSYLLKKSDSPSVVAMAVATNPLVVLAMSWLFLGEAVTLKKVMGCVVTIAGLILLV